MAATLHHSSFPSDFPDLTTHRYLPGRPSTTNPNPRGKHHRKPLPWRRTKLATAQSYATDAALWYKHLWTLLKESPDSDTPPPRPAKPHLLAYVEANARRHKDIYGRCECCYEIMMSRTWEDKKREWDTLRKEGRDMYDYEEELRMSAGGINLELAENGEGDLSMEDVWRGREEPVYVVRWKVGRRKKAEGVVFAPVSSGVETRSRSSTPGLDSESMEDGGGFMLNGRWEWEFVGQGGASGWAWTEGGTDDGSRSGGIAEWVAVSEGGTSEDDSDFDDWERCR